MTRWYDRRWHVVFAFAGVILLALLLIDLVNRPAEYFLCLNRWFNDERPFNENVARETCSLLHVLFPSLWF